MRERLEEVPDGELEQVRIVDRPAREGKASLEPQRSERREPADTEADAVEEAERQGPVALRALEEVLRLREDVAGVVEDHAPQARAAQDGKFDLPVGDQFLVAAHRA